MSALAAATNINGVTCVVPAYNASQTIDACLASLRAQRTDLPIEVLIVDDGSEDDTSVKARQWPRRGIVPGTPPPKRLCPVAGPKLPDWNNPPMAGTAPSL